MWKKVLGRIGRRKQKIMERGGRGMGCSELQ